LTKYPSNFFANMQIHAKSIRSLNERPETLAAQAPDTAASRANAAAKSAPTGLYD
jgi:hypothetical protein